MRTALIVVDMQKGSFTDTTPRFDAENLVQRLNDLAARVRAASGLVIFIQHNGPKGDAHHPGNAGWELLADLETDNRDHFVNKTTCDAFIDTELSSILNDAQVQRLIVTGCASDFCVDTTIRSALAHGFETIAPSDGHTTADRPYLTAQKIIEHHNAIWADFMSPAGAAQSIPCSDVKL